MPERVRTGRRRFQSSSYDSLMDNHTICLLSYLERNPDAHQTYYALGNATGIPPSTVRELLNWDHFASPFSPDPLYFWADRLGYIVTRYPEGAPIRVSVVRRGI